MSTQTTARKANAYAGTCAGCDQPVPALDGHLGGKIDGRWIVLHNHCTPRPASSQPTTSRPTTSRPASQTCDECGHRTPYLVPATDLSGIPGMVCHRCAAEGGLSFC